MQLYIWCAGSYIRNTHYGSGIAVTDSQCSADENLAERDLKVMMKTKSMLLCAFISLKLLSSMAFTQLFYAILNIK